MSDELKPCPWCGRHPSLETWSSGGMMCGVGCFNPNRRVTCMGRGRSPKEAAEAWNARALVEVGDEIAPCPFCGSEPDAYEWTNKQGETRFVIECRSCNCRPMLISGTQEEAVDVWNKRA